MFLVQERRSNYTTSLDGVSTSCHMEIQKIKIGSQTEINSFAGIPFVLILIYVITMTIRHSDLSCWKGYSEMDEIWIVIGPILAVLLVIQIFT